jgi:acetone carboxylase gamma subunit
MANEEISSKENLRRLVEGKLPWEEVKQLIREYPKEKDRFWKYLEILQEKVPWQDKILMRISDKLYVVRTGNGSRIVKCECGQEFGDYRINWKLSCLIYVRKTPEEFAEIYLIQPQFPDAKLNEVREFYCPGCLTMLGVEVVPVGYPIMFEMLPDIDTFYREWLKQPLEDEGEEWFQDKTIEQTTRWLSDK